MDEEKSGMLADTKAHEKAATNAQAMVYKPGAKAPLNKKAFWRVLISLELSMVAIALDFYTIPIAVPSLSSRRLGYTNSAWLGTAFLASFALGLLIWPRFCRGFGYKFSFVVAIDTFNLATCFAATTKTPERLIALRLVAGAGAGGACGLFDIILRDIVPPKEVAKYLRASWAVWAVTAVASPLMGGALVEYVRSTLCFDLPFLPGHIGYLMALVYLNLPEPSWSQTSLNLRQFDYLGTLCLTAGTAFFLLVTASGGSLFPWISTQIVSLSICGLAFLTAFVLIEYQMPDPLLDPSLFRNPGLLTIVIAAFFFGANLVGTMYYVPQFFQFVFDDGAMISGLSTMSMMLGMGAGSTASAYITSSRRDILRTARAGAALLALASGLMVRWNTDTSRAETIVVLGLLGVGQGFAMIGLLRSAQDSVDQHAVSTVTRAFAFVQASGHIFGVACFAALYMNKLQPSLAALGLDVDWILADMDDFIDAHGADMRQTVLDAFVSSMRRGWWLMFACAMTVLALTFMVKQHRTRNEVASSVIGDSKSIPEVEKGL